MPSWLSEEDHPAPNKAVVGSFNSFHLDISASFKVTYESGSINCLQKTNKQALHFFRLELVTLTLVVDLLGGDDFVDHSLQEVALARHPG